jgi:hypothetical protein
VEPIRLRSAELLPLGVRINTPSSPMMSSSSDKYNAGPFRRAVWLGGVTGLLVTVHDAICGRSENPSEGASEGLLRVSVSAGGPAV